MGKTLRSRSFSHNVNLKRAGLDAHLITLSDVAYEGLLSGICHGQELPVFPYPTPWRQIEQSWAKLQGWDYERSMTIIQILWCFHQVLLTFFVCFFSWKLWCLVLLPWIHISWGCNGLWLSSLWASIGKVVAGFVNVVTNPLGDWDWGRQAIKTLFTNKESGLWMATSSWHSVYSFLTLIFWWPWQ